MLIYTTAVIICNLISTDCKDTEDGWDYKGKRDVTISGRKCQRWDVLYGDVHNYTDDLYPDDTITEAANYCRNPDRRISGPWCFTSRTDWETCALPHCKGKGKSNLLIQKVQFFLLRICVWF